MSITKPEAKENAKNEQTEKIKVSSEEKETRKRKRQTNYTEDFNPHRTSFPPKGRNRSWRATRKIPDINSPAIAQWPPNFAVVRSGPIAQPAADGWGNYRGNPASIHEIWRGSEVDVNAGRDVMREAVLRVRSSWSAFHAVRWGCSQRMASAYSSSRRLRRKFPSLGSSTTKKKEHRRRQQRPHRPILMPCGRPSRRIVSTRERCACRQQAQVDTDTHACTHSPHGFLQESRSSYI